VEQRVDQGQLGRRRGSFSLRLKLIITFLVVGIVVTGLLSYSVYLILNAGLLRQMQGRVLDLALLGSQMVDKDALARLEAGVSKDVADATVNAAETSADFRAVSETLNRVRSVEGKLVHYIYTFAPTEDPKSALYLVDGDVLTDRAAVAAGKKLNEDVSHYSSAFDISAYPIAQESLVKKTPIVEEAWSYDSDFKVNSITGYAPLFSRDGKYLGELGIDMVDTDVRQILSQAITIMLVVFAGAMLLTVASSVFLGTVFTRGIVRLDRVVRTFDQDNMSLRVQVRSHDEVGRLSASFNEMAETIQKYHARQEAYLQAYGKFVPHEMLPLLGKPSILDVKLGDHAEMDMAVLFSDIRSFTKLSESMTPFENFNFINSYLRRMGPEIRANHGFIDKYIGDAIMALFPAGPEDAITAAVAMNRRLVEYNEHRAKSGYPPIAIGVAVNAGRLMLGTVGEHERMDGSVISDAVNLCSRLESLTRVYGAKVLTTGKTLKGLTSRGAFSSRFIDRVRVRGRREAVLLFEVLDAEKDEVRAQRESYRSEFASAQRMYYGQEFGDASKIFTELAQANPEDPVLSIYRSRSSLLARSGAPDGWEGVVDIDLK
jgi:class 3 adenylate cyclase/HAMP domain-containing protein